MVFSFEQSLLFLAVLIISTIHVKISRISHEEKKFTEKISGSIEKLSFPCRTSFFHLNSFVSLKLDLD